MPSPLISAVVQPAITVTAGSAYASGNDVGGSPIALTGAVNPNKGAGVLQSITVTDASNQKAPLTVLLFSAQPAGGTYADKAGLVLSAADLANCLGVVSITAGNYTSVGTKAVATVNGLNLPVWTKGGTLYALVMTTGTPTYAGASDLGLAFGFQQD